jgi:dehydrogenase/reductase SDR family member 7B
MKISSMEIQITNSKKPMKTAPIIWITGASSGIGLALAQAYAQRGASIVLSARSVDKLEEIRQNLPDPEKHFVLPLDLMDSRNFPEKVQEVVARYGRIDVLINNGGVSQRGEASKTSLEIDRQIMEVNYFGAVALTKAVLPIMQKQQSGHIVAISSIAGKFGFYWRSAYAAAKHAMQGFFEALYLEEAKNNIHVTLVFPGKINTPISVSAINEKGERHGQMDHNQETGMPAEVCAQKIIRAIEKKKQEVLIGNKEIWAVYIKRYCPWLFWRIIRKQSPTG